MVVTSMLFALIVLLIIGGIIAAVIFGIIYSSLIMLIIGIVTLITDKQQEKRYMASAEFSETAVPYKRKKISENSYCNKSYNTCFINNYLYS